MAKKTLFIVGNGPLLSDLSDGVNASDHVIRFNEPKTSFGMSGTKTDWLFICNTGKPMVQRLKDPHYPTSPIVQAAQLVILVSHPITVDRYGLKPKLISRLKGRRAEWTWAALMMFGEAGKTVAVLPPAFYEASCLDLGIQPAESLEERIFPSTGYLGIRYALESLPADEWDVEIAGFGWQGWHGHAWDLERGWIERKVAERNIRIWPSKEDTRPRRAQGRIPDNRLDVYIDTEPSDPGAFDAARKTLKDRASIPVEVHPIGQAELVEKGIYTRKDAALVSTEPGSSRFFTPYLAGYKGWALFCDRDPALLGDVARLLDYRDSSKAVMCVRRAKKADATGTTNGDAQTGHSREGWSSVMLFNCEHPSARKLTPELINRVPRDYLHRLEWAADEEIGELPEIWNGRGSGTPAQGTPDIADLADHRT